MTERLALLDGQAVDARLVDRALLAGDGVFDLFPFVGEYVFDRDARLNRLHAWSEIVNISLSSDALRVALDAALAAAPYEAGFVRLIGLRGGGPSSGQVLSVIEPPRRPAGRPLIASTVRGPLLVDHRVKSTSYGGAMQALRAARAQGADEAIAVNDFGVVLEGATSNVFARFGDEVVTPALECGVFAGLTRARLLGTEGPFQFRCRVLSVSELYRADEIVITSSLRGARSIVELDRWSVGSGRVGRFGEFAAKVAPSPFDLVSPKG